MSRIRWTTSALNDLKTISSYIEGQRNLATANRVCRIACSPSGRHHHQQLRLSTTKALLTVRQTKHPLPEVPGRLSMVRSSPLGQGGSGLPTFNNIPAAIYFVSPGQLNVQVPDGLPSGEVTVTVTTPGGSAVSGVQHQTIAPGMFTIAQVKASDGTSYYYPAAVHADGSLVGRPNVLPGSRPAVSGEIVLVFGTGFGLSSPPQPSGMIFPSTRLDSLPILTFGGNRSAIDAAALISPGLYQFNIQLPVGLKSLTDYAIQIGFLGGSQSQTGVYLPVN